jgi:hypothetical protein
VPRRRSSSATSPDGLKVLDAIVGETDADVVISAKAEGYGNIILMDEQGKMVANIQLQVGHPMPLGQVRLRKRHWDAYHHVIRSGESRYGHGDVLAVPGVKQDGAGVSIEFTIVPLRDGAASPPGWQRSCATLQSALRRCAR